MTESNRLSGNRTPVRATQSPDQPSITLAANYTATPCAGATRLAMTLIGLEPITADLEGLCSIQLS